MMYGLPCAKLEESSIIDRAKDECPAILFHLLWAPIDGIVIGDAQLAPNGDDTGHDEKSLHL
jgi:hypothetical protein